MKTFRFYQDPGHGWLEVSAQDLRELNLTARDFTTYSYVKATSGLYYLEEDCDAPKFIAAWQEKHGVSIVIVDVYQQRSFITSLPRNVAGEWRPFAPGFRQTGA
jgi:hypothetical protein